MNEEEKKAIEILKEFRDYYSREDIYRENFNSNESYKKALKEERELRKKFDIVLNLITKLKKENKGKDKQIDLMAKFIRTNISYDKIIYEICINGKCNNEECHEDDLKECIKQYFEEQAKKEGEN